MEALVDEIEEELNDINTSGEFSLYSDFIKRYSDTYLHRNHYLLMTAARYVKIRGCGTGGAEGACAPPSF